MDYKVSSKRKDNGKWWGYGRIRTNQYGNPQLSFKKTPELMQIFNDAPDGGYINFALFEEKPKEQEAPQQPDNDNSIPF